MIGQTAELLLALFGIFAVIFGYRRRNELAASFSSVRLPGGLEFTFRTELDDALAKRAPTEVSEVARSRVQRRASRDIAITDGARILWVDNTPEGNVPERKVIRSLGVMIDLARTSDEGVDALGRADYDLIISNMNRDGRTDEGERFLSHIRTHGHREPVVFYILNLDAARGTPTGAVGITNRPDELVHLVLDGLERVRG